MKTLEATDVEVGIRRGKSHGPAPRPVASPIVASFLSFVWPGLGQGYLGHPRRALLLGVPPLLLVAGLGFAMAQSPQAFALNLLVPSFALTMILLVALHGLWRVVAVVDAWRLSHSRPRRPDRSLVLALALSILLVAGHGLAGAYLDAFSAAAAPIFGGGGSGDDLWGGGPVEPSPPGGLPDETAAVSPSTVPSPTVSSPTSSPLPFDQDGLINALIVGIDSGPGRDHANTDTLMVASYDIATNRIVMISIPRDIGRFPLYNGGTYAGRINGFLEYAAAHEEQFPEGAMRALVLQVEHIVGVDIDYYAATDMAGLERMVGIVGGINVTADKAINDPFWGFELEPGEHHLDGPTAMMYVRSRFGRGNSDFERARRQQLVIRALGERMKDPAVLARLPEVMRVAAEMARTDVPVERLPEFLGLLDRTDDADMRRIVLQPPKYAHRIPPSETGGMFLLGLKMDAVEALSVEVFGQHSRFARSGRR